MLQSVFVQVHAINYLQLSKSYYISESKSRSGSLDHYVRKKFCLWVEAIVAIFVVIRVTVLHDLSVLIIIIIVKK